MHIRDHLTCCSRSSRVQKIDIGAISIADITDQYLAEVERMKDLDLDIASDFLVVAATLLQIKASSLLPKEVVEPIELDDELANLTPEQTRDILVERLVVYKQFRTSRRPWVRGWRTRRRCIRVLSAPTSASWVSCPITSRMSPCMGWPSSAPTSRRDVTPFCSRPSTSPPCPFRWSAMSRGFTAQCGVVRAAPSNRLVGPAPAPELVVVTFLAILELYKRGVIKIFQDVAFDEIQLDIEPDAPEITDFSVPDWGMPDDPSLEQFDEDDAGETDDGIEASGPEAFSQAASSTSHEE